MGGAEILELPRIGVLPFREMDGLYALADLQEVDPLDCVDFETAFSQCYQEDAHFICYQPFPPIETWCRINKKGTVLHEMRENGFDLHSRVFVFDIDNPGHKPWHECGLTWEGFLSKLAKSAAEGHSIAATWAVAYPTRGGARLVYVLNRGVPVDEAESLYRGCIAALAKAGVIADPSCANWDREFRLPFVTRAADQRGPKHATWEADYCRAIQWQLSERLDVDTLVPIGPPANVPSRLALELDWDQPSVEEARALVENVQDGKLTEWGKQAKKRLMNKECFRYCFEGAALPEGDRNPGIHRIVGQAINNLYPVPERKRGLEGTTPAHIYGLFVESVAQLEPDSDDPDWFAVLYQAVGKYWSQTAAEEDAKAETQKLTETARELDVSELVYQVRDGMRRWCSDPTLHSQDEAKSLLWLREHLIACNRGGHHIMTRSGYYDGLAVGLPYVPSRIRELGMELLMPLTEMNENGDMRPVSPSQLVTRYGTNVANVRGEVEQPGAWIENVGSDKATLVQPMFSRRKDLTPRFDPDVDEWLKLFFGMQYEKGCKWIGWALAFDQGSICALSVSGKPGVGKKLLVQGLRECLDTQELAHGSDLIATHATGLLKSCFLSINEGFPTMRGASNPADSFRRLVSGECEPINPKYGSLIRIENPVRIIIAANNLEVARILTGGRNLSPDDRDALAVRLWHVKVADNVADWFNQKGGEEQFTGRHGHRWIKGDGGKASDYVVARHFLWLYENRGARIGKRFLVDGDRDSDIMLELCLTGDGLPVCETILDMLNSMGSGKSSGGWSRGITIENGRLWVLSSAIKEFAQKRGMSRFDGFGSNIVADVLKGLRVADHGSIVLESRREIGKQRWNEIQIPLLRMVAESKLQKPCPLLTKLAEGAPVTQIPDHENAPRPGSQLLPTGLRAKRRTA